MVGLIGTQRDHPFFGSPIFRHTHLPDPTTGLSRPMERGQAIGAPLSQAFSQHTWMPWGAVSKNPSIICGRYAISPVFLYELVAGNWETTKAKRNTNPNHRPHLWFGCPTATPPPAPPSQKKENNSQHPATTASKPMSKLGNGSKALNSSQKPSASPHRKRQLPAPNNNCL